MKPKTLQQHLKRFDYVNSNIKEGIFPLLEVSDKLEYKLFHFDRYISSEDAVKEIKEAGYDPATFSELLAWPDWNEKDWVAVLGSVCEVGGYRNVPYFDGYDSKRRLGLSWWDGGWYAGCRFLGVRKLPSDSRTSETNALVPLDSLKLEKSLKELHAKVDTLLAHLGIK